MRGTAVILGAVVMAGMAGAGGVTVRDGWDFSLPGSVKPAPYAGLLFMDNPAKSAAIIHEGYRITWAEMNPAQAKFDFSRVRSLLDRAQRRGRGVLLRLKCSETYGKAPWGEHPSYVPEWVVKKHSPAIADMAAGEDDTYPGCVIKVAVPWDTGVHLEFLRFVKAFGESGLPRHPALFGLYIQGISTSLGEEFWFTRKAFDNLKAAGMTPGKLERAFADRIRAWAAAFGDERRKLAWVGAGWIEAPDDEWEAYKALGDRLDALALAQGLGWRGGGIETYNQLSFPGSALDDGGYMVADEAHPLLAEPRFFGDENEVYDTRAQGATHAYRSSVLRALSAGMRFLWTSDEAVALDPDVSRYFDLTAGKRGKESPDAWTWLREVKGRRSGKEYRYRNFEKHLFQREAEGFRTRPALFTARRREWTDAGEAGDWAARSTDLDSGQKAVGLRVDPLFRPGGKAWDATIKVTFVDDGGEWKVAYATATGPKESAVVRGKGKGAIRTATLGLPGFLPGGRGPLGFDLALTAVRGDLTATFVRLM